MGRVCPPPPPFFFFFCLLKSQNIETHSLKQSLGQEWYDHYRELAIVRFEGGTMIGGRCHTDVLGFGPTSSPEKASGVKFCFDFSSYMYHIGTCSSLDLEITRGQHLMLFQSRGINVGLLHLFNSICITISVGQLIQKHVKTFR